jgi:uncharacterized membrane protein
VDIALFTANARLVAALATAVLLVSAFYLRRLRARRRVPSPALEALAIASSLLGLGGVLALGGEQLVALAVRSAAPAGSSFNEWRWVLGAPWGRFGILAGFAVVALTLVFSYRGTARERPLWRRALLVALRAGACAAALVLFLEPALELRHVTREPNHIAVLVDDSRSMQLAEAKGGPTRAARAAQLIAASAPMLARWREEHLIDFFTFSDSLLPASETQLATPQPGRGDASLLREALEQVRGRYDSHDLAGVVVVSDGAMTGRMADGVEDGASQDFLKALGTRVHTVWAGRPGLQDLAVARIDADDFAFVRTVVKVEAVLRATGLPPTEVPVVLKRDGQVVKQVTAHVGGALGDVRVTFELVPERVGKFVYEVAVPVLPVESVPENNSRAFVMRVTRDKTRVLQVAGRPSWDERALRGFFKSDPNVDLISFFILRTYDTIQAVPTEEMSLIPFPTEELFEQELGSFDVIVLQDFEFGKYGIRPYLDNLRAYAENGGGLAMIGGDQSFSSGGYYGTPVADALPVELLPPLGAPDHLLSIEPFHPHVTDEGARHPVTQLRFDRRDNLARFAGLPPLEGANRVAGAKPNATVLLEHPTLRGRNGKPMPVLVAGEYGKGRTLAFLSDSAWRWGFVAAGRDGDDGRAYQKLWENTVRWLIRDPELEYLHVDADQAEYKRQSAIHLHARLVDKDYRPDPGVEITLQVVGADTPMPSAAAPGSRSGRTAAPPAAAPPRQPPVLEKVLKSDEAGEVALEAGPLPPGAYRLIGKATLGDRPVFAEDVFLVAPEREELEHPAAREDILQGVARATGGTYLGAASALDAGLPFTPPRIVRVDKRSDVEVWSRPYVFVLALVLLGTEWALRRRRGFL